jgi:hypothetical protein
VATSKITPVRYVGPSNDTRELLLSRFGCGVFELSREEGRVSYVNWNRVSNARLIGSFKAINNGVRQLCRNSEGHLAVLHHRPDPVAISWQYYLGLSGLERLQNSFGAGPPAAILVGRAICIREKTRIEFRLLFLDP